VWNLTSAWSVTVKQINRVLRLLLPVAVAAALLGPGLPVRAGTAASTVSVTKYTGTFKDGATYLIEVPAKWNGTLFLYSHGYVVPGTNNPAMDVGDPVTRGWMLNHGYALAGSSYATTGWAVQAALPDQIHTLNVFNTLVGTKPTTTIAWGHSLGGMITAGLIQRHPTRFNAALPMCGVLSGGIATWNTALDAEVAFQQLIDPSVQVVNITNPGGNLQNALLAAQAAQKTAAGRARLALGAALSDTPGWFTPLSAQPAPDAYLAQEANQYQWDTQVDFPFVFALRAQLEAVAGGNPSWTTGVNYFRQLLKSANLKEVLALYHRAHLDLQADLAKLAAAPRVKADPAAVTYLRRNITFNGQLGDRNTPVLTMHTVGDGLVVPENEWAYENAVANAGNTGLLRQVFVDRAGHCAFTPAETITAVKSLVNRLKTGQWNDASLTPAKMNARAAALGPKFNVFAGPSGPVATPPGFLSYTPPPYPRPYNIQPK
jgi:pimeloyl-ACP methyl ester carboxylesterase